MQDFKDLKVWQKAHALVLEIYKASAEFPKEEVYGLTSQIRRAAMSIPANIAEGRGRAVDGDLRRFIQIALGSASELEYHLILSKDLHYLDEQTTEKLTTQLSEIRRMLISFVQVLKKP